MNAPQSFDAALPGYKQALTAAFQQTGCPVAALEAVAELRGRVIALPTHVGINKHFRLEQIESQLLHGKAAITSTPVSTQDLDW